MGTHLGRVETLACCTLAAALAAAFALARAGHDTGLDLAFHPVVVALCVLALLACSLLRRTAAVLAVVGVLIALVCGLAASEDHGAQRIVRVTGLDGRYSLVATDNDSTGQTHFWVERHGLLLVRRVPAGCTTSTDWGLSRRDDTHIVVHLDGLSSAAEEGDRTIDAPGLIAQGGTDEGDCA